MVPHVPRTPSCQQSQEQSSPGPITLVCDEQPETDLETEKSHFLARTCRTDSIDEARGFIADVRSTYPDARHHCSTLTLTDLSNGRALAAIAPPTERSNDGDESSDTAGRPMLDILRGTRLANTTVVVTRYFGGTLLGTDGLVRAYSGMTAQVLQAAARVTLTRLRLWGLRVPMARAGRIEAELRSHSPVAASGPTVEGGTAVSAPTIRVEETIWGPTHVILVLAMSCADPDLLHAPLAALARGGRAAEPAGSRLVEIPVPPA